MIEDGKTGPQIAAEMCITRSEVYRIIHSDAELYAKFKAPAGLDLRDLNVRVGSLGPLLKKRDPALVDWLIAETPSGGEIVATLLAIAEDTFADEQDAKRSAAV